MQRRPKRAGLKPPSLLLIKMAVDFWDNAEIIDAYTDEQAVEDGVLIPVKFGSINRITRTVLHEFAQKNRSLEKFNEFVDELIKKFESQRNERDDWFYSIEIEGSNYFVVENGSGFTLMKPGDY